MNDIRKYINLIKDLGSNILINENKINKVGWDVKPENWEYSAAIVSIKDEDQRSLEIVSESANFDKDDKEILTENYHDKCAICGHKIVNKVLFKNNENEKILVGFDCANNIMKFRFDVAGAKTQGLRNRIQTIKLSNIYELLTKYPGLDLWLTSNHYIVNNIRDNFYKYAKISEKQVELVKKLYGERTEYEKTAKPFPIGNFNGEIKITSAKIKGYKEYNDNKNNYSGVYIIGEHEDGWKLYGLLFELGNSIYIYNSFNYENSTLGNNRILNKLLNTDEIYKNLFDLEKKMITDPNNGTVTLNSKEIGREKIEYLNNYITNTLVGKKINISANLKENIKDPYMGFVKGKIILP